MPTKNPTKKVAKLPASVELVIVYPAKLYIKDMDSGNKNALDKKIHKIVGRVQDASGCDVGPVRGGKRDLRWQMVRRNRIKTIETAIAKLGIPGVKVVVSERKTA